MNEILCINIEKEKPLYSIFSVLDGPSTILLCLESSLVIRLIYGAAG